MVQASLSKGVYKAHAFAAALRVMYWDMMRSNFVGRSLDALLTDGVRMGYDKHLDQNTYVGFEKYDTTGLINNPDAVETTVARALPVTLPGQKDPAGDPQGYQFGDQCGLGSCKQ